MVMYDAEAIKSLRLALGDTLAQFGERIGVSESTVCCWETGRNHPRFGALRALNELAAGLKDGTVEKREAKKPVLRGPRMPKVAS